jgi:hypothetical protein
LKKIKKIVSVLLMSTILVACGKILPQNLSQDFSLSAETLAEKKIVPINFDSNPALTSQARERKAFLAFHMIALISKQYGA